MLKDFKDIAKTFLVGILAFLILVLIVAVFAAMIKYPAVLAVVWFIVVIFGIGETIRRSLKY